MSRARLLRPHVLLAAALLLGGGCVRSVPEPRPSAEAALGADFRVNRGQTVAIPGERMTVTFTRVIEDSRCAAGVQCIRAGQARAELELRLPNRAAERVVVNTPSQPAYASFGAYDVRLVALEPLPRAGQRTRRYTAVIRVTKR